MPSPLLEQILAFPYFARIRRNHALEHATINLLSKKVPGIKVAGRSDSRGFWVFGELTTELLADTVAEALKRLHDGEGKLAIHRNCGTNFVVSGFLAAAASLFAFSGTRSSSERLGRLPLAALFSTLVLIFGRPLGLKLQNQITTEADPGALMLLDVRLIQKGSMTAHRVNTRS